MNDVINILGLNITNLEKNKVFDNIKEILKQDIFNYIITLNPEITLQAIRDEEYFYIINKANLVIADGIGLKFASFLSKTNIPRITGVLLSKTILEFCNSNKKRVLIVNWKDGLSDNKIIEQMLNKEFPGLDFFVYAMPREKENWNAILQETAINNFQPDAMLCLFGAPYQEKFIYHIARQIPGLKLAVGVGGAFDFFTGKRKRAPKLFQTIGLEWLWRLAIQPQRWKRIYNAVIVFPYKFLRWRFVLPHFYRKNVACLLYKIEQGKKMVLLVEREDNPDYWQLPQGGTEGEDLEKAGKRELNEEINCNNFKFIAAYKNLYKYKFGERKEKKDYVKIVQKHLGYKGQCQSLYIAKFTGSDNEIKINFWEHTDWKWVPEDKVLETVHECRRPAMKIYLNILSKIKN